MNLKNFLGNEWLTDSRGYTAGEYIIYNSGCMSSSNGPYKGWSKGQVISYVWLNCEIPLHQAVNFGGAWTSVHMDSFTMARLPITMCLAEAVDEKFWVCYSIF